VGAETVRKDNPRLRVRDTKLQEWRSSQRKPIHPTKVTVTTTGNLAQDAQFFTEDGSKKIVYTVNETHDRLFHCLQGKAEVIAIGESKVHLPLLMTDLASRGYEHLLIEGGMDVHTQCLEQDLADELQISIAPFFVGESDAPKFVRASSFPYKKDRSMKLHEVIQLGNIALLRYLLKNDSKQSITGSD
jgi:5-amino-6-(5-phosphoribosylamino)uracil reductase